MLLSPEGTGHEAAGIIFIHLFLMKAVVEASPLSEKKKLLELVHIKTSQFPSVATYVIRKPSKKYVCNKQRLTSFKWGKRCLRSDNGLKNKNSSPRSRCISSTPASSHRFFCRFAF